MQDIRSRDYERSLNSSDESEPGIFNLVRLQIAAKHFEIYGENSLSEEAVRIANNQDFLIKINQKLKLVGLKVEIQFTDRQRWAYSFQFFDLRRNVPLSDINSLSAGQKAIIHLVFEAFGRGEIQGGLIIIDEPEIHLHYQFQYEYLQIINEINKEQNCQYVLVTHSESLIDINTIRSIRRFSLDADNATVINFPVLTENDKTLVKMLDNTRSTYAFFGKKVLLVEGETDRYFFRSLIRSLNPDIAHEIAVLDMIGKGEHIKWRKFFEGFGLKVYFIGDFDAVCGEIYYLNPAPKLNSDDLVRAFKGKHPDAEAQIEKKYSERIFILKHGDLEHYLGVPHKSINDVVTFCDTKLSSFIQGSSPLAAEIKSVYNQIIGD